MSIYLIQTLSFHSYGFTGQFRPPLTMPNQVYSFDPVTGSVRVVADGFNIPNGIAFSQDGKTAYVYVHIYTVLKF